MTGHSSKKRNALEIVLLAILLLAGYALFQKLTGSRAVLLESNLQSNLACISRYLHAPKVDTVLVGSSIAGRLLPEYFGDQGLEVANLGLNGCGALYGLEVVGMRKDLPKLVLVDTSGLFKQSSRNEATLREAVSSPTFHMGAGFPPFRAENRPLSLLYWWLKKSNDRRDAGRIHHAWIPYQVKTLPYETDHESARSVWIYDPSDWGGAQENASESAIKQTLGNLKARGVDIRLVDIPRAEGWGHPVGGKLRRFSEELGVPLLEPGVGIARTNDTLRFTDGRHLDLPSARSVAQEICEELKKPDREQTRKAQGSRD